MKRSNLIILGCMAAGIVILVMLGSWQVKRLFWKEALLEQIQSRTKQAAISVSDITSEAVTPQTHNYTPAFAKGAFDHSKEVFYYTSGESGAGWNVHTPLVLEDGSVLIVNRGFVPFEMKETEQRSAGQLTGTQTIKGLIIVPKAEKPNSFVPDNAPQKREFYWRDLPAMAAVIGEGSESKFKTFFLDADKTPNPGGLPIGGATIVSLPNNHLQYAATWYGLALTLLGVGSYFLYTRRREEDD